MARQGHELGKVRARPLKFVQGSVRGDSAGLNECDVVRQRKSGMAVRDKEQRDGPFPRLQRCDDGCFGRGVDSRGRVVQNKHARTRDQGPCERNTLPLPAR